MTVERKTILIVDDDPDILEIVRARLEASGFRVLSAESAEAGLKSFFDNRPALAILDVNLPGMDGYELCDRIRELSQAPVIFLTARGQEIDRVRGLRGGADDYIVKPFGGEELVARIEAVLRRAGQPSVDGDDDRYSDGEVAIDFKSHIVTVRGEDVHLTGYEYRMLVAFVRHPMQVLGPEQILDLVWGNDALEASRDSVRLYAGYLRNKIEADPKSPTLIETVRGFGYRYRPPA